MNARKIVLGGTILLVASTLISMVIGLVISNVKLDDKSTDDEINNAYGKWLGGSLAIGVGSPLVLMLAALLYLGCRTRLAHDEEQPLLAEQRAREAAIKLAKDQRKLTAVWLCNHSVFKQLPTELRGEILSQVAMTGNEKEEQIKAIKVKSTKLIAAADDMCQTYIKRTGLLPVRS